MLSHRLLELEVKIEMLKRRLPERALAQTRADIEAVQKELEDITVSVLKINVPLKLTLSAPILN